ncbi:MAG: NAD-dependent epimerase/dehydratase family protein [Terriglobales bacterium]|jgi:nucleoside-diphosphate-sugar epimerase
MDNDKPVVVVTGLSGNLGLRLLPQLTEFQVIGVDIHPPETTLPVHFVAMDFGEEDSCREFYLLLKEYRPVAVVHLAFVIDPQRAGVVDPDRMWQINVAGTARVLEAIAEANREDAIVEKFIYPSSVAVYGPDLNAPVTEDAPLRAHTLPYAVHKMECDKVVQQRAPALQSCSVYMLRAHIFAGKTVDNYLMGAFRGTPNGKSKRAAKMRSEDRRLPCMLPYGQRYLDHQLQFVHVDDIARLILHILRKTEPEAQRITVLNVAGRGDPLSFARCIELAHAKLMRVPGKWGFGIILAVLWKLRLSSIPPEALPYMTGQYTMNTDRLRKFLGPQYETVIQYKITDAYTDSFAK